MCTTTQLDTSCESNLVSVWGLCDMQPNPLNEHTLAEEPLQTLHTEVIQQMNSNELIGHVEEYPTMHFFKFPTIGDP